MGHDPQRSLSAAPPSSEAEPRWVGPARVGLLCAIAGTWAGLVLSLVQPGGVTGFLGLGVAGGCYLAECGLAALLRRRYPPSSSSPDSSPSAGLFRSYRRVTWLHRLVMVLLSGGCLLFIVSSSNVGRWIGLGSVALGMLLVVQMWRIASAMSRSDTSVHRA